METKHENATVHVVSKQNNVEHAAFNMPGELPNALGPSSVRVRTKMITLSSNNLSYARGGHVLRWWDAYPVPSSAPAPYNNTQDWGIVPAWGYGEVIASTIPQFKAGSVLYGFWPTSSLAVDLNLKPIAPEGHWFEISEGRKLLMPIYNRYETVKEEPKTGDDEKIKLTRKGWSAALTPVFGSSFSFNCHVFPGLKGVTGSTIPVHPLGPPDQEWTAQDADLSSAVVVSLSASSKTGRAFAWQFLRNRDVENKGPLALLEVSRSPASLLQSQLQQSSTMATRAVYYNDLTGSETVNWITDLKPQRIVIIDFGAEMSVIEKFVSSMKGCGLSTTLIGVGGEMKVLSQEETLAKQVRGQKLGRIQFNANGLRERGIELDGADEYFKEVGLSFKAFLEERGYGPLELTWGSGIAGLEGVEGAWTRLCLGQVKTENVLVFKI